MNTHDDIMGMIATEAVEAGHAQQVMDGLSRSVKALCEAIDPDHTHGPETESIVAWENEIRADVKLLLTNLYSGAYQGDMYCSDQVLSLVRKLGWAEEIEDRLGWNRKLVRFLRELTEEPKVP